MVYCITHLQSQEIFEHAETNLNCSCYFFCVQTAKARRVVQFCKKTKRWVDKAEVRVSITAQSCILNSSVFLYRGNILMCFGYIYMSSSVDVEKI